MKNYVIDNDALWSDAQKMSGTGWCVVDLDRRLVVLSRYLSDILHIPDGVCDIDRFRGMIDPEYLFRSDIGRNEWAAGKVYDQIYPLMVDGTRVWVRVRVEASERQADEGSLSVGTIRIMDQADPSLYARDKQSARLGELIDSQSDVSELLLNLLQTQDADSIINGILQNILEKFDADRSYIFSFDAAARTHSCVYEVTVAGVTSEMEGLQNFPFDATQWWCDELLANRPIILDEVRSLDGVHPAEFEILDMQSIRSLMVMPLLSGDGVWGYIGVDIVDRYRTWSLAEQQWFRTISNYISVCLAMHRTASEARRTQALFDSVSHFAEVGFFSIDVVRGKFYATPQWYNNMSVPPFGSDDVSLYSGLMVSSVHPDDNAEMQAHMNGLLEGRIPSFKQDIRVRDGEGWRWLRCMNMTSEYDPSAGKVTVIGLNSNITETKDVENTLIEARRKAEESDRLKSSFLANMSHEIRTPLNAIVGFSNLLTETDDSDERRQYASIIQHTNDSLLQLIADILDLSKIEAGVLDISMAPADINVLCANVVSSMTMKVHTGVDMIFDPGLERCAVRTDRNRLSQILANYLGNAAKFTSEGAIKLSYALLQDGQIEFSVEDTGMGMTPEQLESVFGRFVKFNHFIPGTGLGLSICKSIAEKMGGSVGVESEIGRGSRFWVRLPYVPESIDAQTRPSPVAAARRSALADGRKKVLLAEDTDSNALLVTAALKDQYELLRATNGAEAVELCTAHRPDIILMDMKMPGMDGLEATAMIRRTDSKVPIIAITAFAYDSDREKAFEAGCTAYVPKPISPSRLREVVRLYI